MATKKGIVSIPSSGGEAGLNRYLAEIKKFPILSPEEEYMLAKRWREHGDTEAAAKLVRRSGGTIVGAAFIIDLPDLGGSKLLESHGIQCHSLVAFEGH